MTSDQERYQLCIACMLESFDYRGKDVFLTLLPQIREKALSCDEWINMRCAHSNRSRRYKVCVACPYILEHIVIAGEPVAEL